MTCHGSRASGRPERRGQRHVQELGQAPPTGGGVAVAGVVRGGACRSSAPGGADEHLGVGRVRLRGLDRTIGMVVGRHLRPVADQQASDGADRRPESTLLADGRPAARPGCAGAWRRRSRSRTARHQLGPVVAGPEAEQLRDGRGPGDAVDRQARRCAGTRRARPTSGRRRSRRPGRCRSRGRSVAAAARRRRRRGASGTGGRGSGRRGVVRPRPGPTRSGARRPRRPAVRVGTGTPRRRPGCLPGSALGVDTRRKSPARRAAAGRPRPPRPVVTRARGRSRGQGAQRPAPGDAGRHGTGRPARGHRVPKGARRAPGGAAPCPWRPRCAWPARRP